jgi:hypothetical protein
VVRSSQKCTFCLSVLFAGIAIRCRSFRSKQGHIEVVGRSRVGRGDGIMDGMLDGALDGLGDDHDDAFTRTILVLLFDKCVEDIVPSVEATGAAVGVLVLLWEPKYT